MLATWSPPSPQTRRRPSGEEICDLPGSKALLPSRSSVRGVPQLPARPAHPAGAKVLCVKRGLRCRCFSAPTSQGPGLTGLARVSDRAGE